MTPIPSPETLSGYEKLGIIGILLLVLSTGLVVIVWAVRQLKVVARDFITFVTHQTAALTEVKVALEQQQETDLRLHERLDNLLSCTREGCPVFRMRQQQQRDAERAPETPPCPSTPPQPA
jgi:hypothetical protein